MKLEIELDIPYAAAGAMPPQQPARLTCYLLPEADRIPDQREKPLVLVCPGGGYAYRSEREAEPIAMQFLAAGMHAAILHYSVAPNRYPTAALELAYAVQHIRRNAQALHVSHVFIIGFSAGGHLCATLGTLWKDPIFAAALGDDFLWKPDAQLLCYPVITLGEFAHAGSRECLLGPDAPQALIDALSLETRVDADTVPTFLWHTVTDASVPVENALFYATALRRANVPFELHLYERGVHGLSLCNATTATGPQHIEPDAASWLDHALRFLARRLRAVPAPASEILSR